MRGYIILLQVFVAASIFFVWVVRYQNIIAEFKKYGLPDWLRDFVGILKITCAILLLVGIERPRAAVFAGALLALLMVAALITHVRVKNPLFEMIPAATLLLLSLAIAYLNYGLLYPHP